MSHAAATTSGSMGESDVAPVPAQPGSLPPLPNQPPPGYPAPRPAASATSGALPGPSPMVVQGNPHGGYGGGNGAMGYGGMNTVYASAGGMPAPSQQQQQQQSVLVMQQAHQLPSQGGPPPMMGAMGVNGQVCNLPSSYPSCAAAHATPASPPCTRAILLIPRFHPFMISSLALRSPRLSLERRVRVWESHRRAA